MDRLHRRVFIFAILFVLLWELFDPSTSFIRASAAESNSSGSLSVAQADTGTSDDADDDSPSRSPADADNVHSACAAMIFVFKVEVLEFVPFIERHRGVLPAHVANIFQPPKRA